VAFVSILPGGESAGQFLLPTCFYLTIHYCDNGLYQN
jgi:hypothetical protein